MSSENVKKFKELGERYRLIFHDYMNGYDLCLSHGNGFPIFRYIDDRLITWNFYISKENEIEYSSPVGYDIPFNELEARLIKFTDLDKKARKENRKKMIEEL